MKEISIVTIFRYANVYEQAIDLMSSGKINLKPLISKVYPFANANVIVIEAFDVAAQLHPDIVKILIKL